MRQPIRVTPSQARRLERNLLGTKKQPKNTILIEEVICPICNSIVNLYDGNKVGMHTPHTNVKEPICKSSGVEILPRRHK